MSSWLIFTFVGSGLLFLSSIVIALCIRLLENKIKNKPIKNTIIAKLDLFNRKFFIEKLAIKNKKNLKNIDIKKWNRLSTITNSFTHQITKKFAEILNNLDKGAKKEEFVFKSASPYMSTKQAQYHFSFHKIDNSTDYLLIINFDHINFNSQDQTIKKIRETTKSKIIKNEKKVKGFVAFNIKKNIDQSAASFLQIINLKRETQNVFYFKYKAMLVFVIFKDTTRQVQKVITKIRDQVQSMKLTNILRYLYNGSAIAISSKTSAIKYINQILQTLGFLIIGSLKNHKSFLSANAGIDHEEFKAYNQALKIFNQTIKNKSFQIGVTSVKNIDNKRRVVDYVFPLISNIHHDLLGLMVKDATNQTKLVNVFAEKMLFEISKTPIMIDVNDMWLAENVDQIINRKALMVINFEHLTGDKNKVDLVQEVNRRNLTFALHVKQYDDSLVSFLKTTKPHFILIGDGIWSENKLLSSQEFMKLISLNALSVENKTKMIYKNPSLILDKKTYAGIGLKYYFEK